MKFKAIETFNWNGVPISKNKSNELLFHEENKWVEGEIYEGDYYDGGVMCPVSGYFIEDSNGNKQVFTQILTRSYMSVYDYFDFDDPERNHTRYVWNYCYRCNNDVFNLLEDDNPICPHCEEPVQKEK